MDARRLELIPDRALNAAGTAALRSWLDARGWRMSLYELDQERRRRRARPAPAVQYREVLPMGPGISPRREWTQ